MTPSELSDLHTRAFTTERGWSTHEFERLLSLNSSSLFTRPHGFLLVQTVLDEAEILTLAVDPSQRRQGTADALMRDFFDATGTANILLEVAQDNEAALALYNKLGFKVSGTRSAYYDRADGPKVDAVLMTRAMTHRHSS